jgi:isoquinoline 1-oxidoreductase beta subunit
VVFDPTKESSNAPSIGRRRFLSYLLAAPTLTVATEVLLNGAAATAEAAVPSPPQLIGETVDLQDIINLIGAPTSALLFQITVNEDDTVTVPLPRAEVGQGLTTSIPMLIAEEMDIPLANIKMPLADARPELLYGQLTGGSSSITSLYKPARFAAAAARARLVATAANSWGLSDDQLTVSNGVIHAPDGRSATFGSLAVAAAKAKLPDLPVRLKPESEFKLVGSRVGRLDAHRIVTGSNTYTQDLDVAGAKPCVVRRPPTINGTVKAVHNADAVKQMPGIIDVATIPTGVAVLAETFAFAVDGVNALDVTWGPGTVDNESDETVQRKLRDAVGPLGDPPVKLPASGVETLEMEFDFAFLSHAPLETNAAVADVRDGHAEVWAAVQIPTSTQENIARELGLPQTSVTVHVMPSGGSFGRRLFNDAAVEAALISRAMRKPVKTDLAPHRRHPARARAPREAPQGADALRTRPGALLRALERGGRHLAGTRLRRRADHRCQQDPGLRQRERQPTDVPRHGALPLQLRCRRDPPARGLHPAEHRELAVGLLPQRPWRRGDRGRRARPAARQGRGPGPARLPQRRPAAGDPRQGRH